MISFLWHSSGYGPIVTDRRATGTAWHLEAGVWPLYDRSTYVEESSKDDCYNDFTIQYAYNAQEDVYAKIVTVTADDSLLCSLSLNQMGHRPHDVIEARYIFDENTALYIVDWMVDHLTLPSYYVEYAASASMFVRVKPGDNVTITDSEFGWDKIQATVEKTSWDKGVCTLGLRVWWRYYTLGGGSENLSGGHGSGQ